MSVKVDQIFLNAVIAMFASAEADETQELQLFKTDCKQMESKLMDYAVQSSAEEQKHFYDILHFSPLKVSHAKSEK
jgi:vacuolar protein sorting-associated protein 13A/C